MPLISILSSAYAPTATHLPETIRSVEKLDLPDGWQLEWVIQEDGPEPKLGGLFDELPFARYEANGRQMGLAYTRNLGLARVHGDLVHVLDHDDLLLPHALTTMIPAFDDPQVQWAIGQADDLLPDGQRVAYPPALPFGFVPAPTVNDWAIANGGNWPLHCAGLTMRTDILRAIGGWVAIPIDDDVAMFAALAEIADGYHEEAVTWLYRHHPDQTHKAASWQARKDEGRRIALQRVAALRRSPLRTAPPARSQEPQSDTYAVGPLHPDKLRHEPAPR